MEIIFEDREKYNGNKPSANLNVVALSEMAKLTDNYIKYPAAHKTILCGQYVNIGSKYRTAVLIY